MAQAFDEPPMYDPKAIPSYEAMARETPDQYRAIKNRASDLRLSPVNLEGYPYGANPREVALDVGDKGHMAFFKTEPRGRCFRYRRRGQHRAEPPAAAAVR